MATKFESESDLNSPPADNDMSDGEGNGSIASYGEEEKESFDKEELETELAEEETAGLNQEDIKPSYNNNVSDILKRLQASGALIKKPKEELHCFTCDEDYDDWEDFENHLKEHVSLPSIFLERLPSDDEEPMFDDEVDSSDADENEIESDTRTVSQNIVKMDISQILKKTGLTIKKPSENKNSGNSDSALSKLSGLGFTIKKNSTPIKEEKDEDEQEKSSDVMQKLNKLGGIKLKLKSDGSNTNSFKVVNGLRDFKTSDDEDEESDGGKDEDEQKEKEQPEGSEDEHSDANKKTDNQRDSDSDEEIPLINRKQSNHQEKKAKMSKDHSATQSKQKQNPAQLPSTKPSQVISSKQQPTSNKAPTKTSGRPAVKQTPKRGAAARSSISQEPKPPLTHEVTTNDVKEKTSENNTSLEKPQSSEQPADKMSESLVVKKEVESATDSESLNMPLFSNKIKTEKSSPPPSDITTTPEITKVKSEPESVLTTLQSQPLFSNPSTAESAPLLPPKKEDEGVVIEINGDSNDEDDDCCVVSSTPAPDVKPVVPKPENVTSSYQSSSSGYQSTRPSSQSNFDSSLLASRLSHTPSTEKQHSFNWNAPDSKPPIDMLEKSADDIFESLLSSGTKKENLSSLSDASEYISLDKLGPQHSCDVCNTRFTDISLLEDHIRMTGHSRSIITPSSSTLMPYNPNVPSNLFSNLLPVKQLAEQVGKLSSIGAGPGFTHQQNVMINIQAYPGGSGVMGPPPPSYSSNQGMHAGYQQPNNNMMYGNSGANMQNAYPNQQYMHSNYGPQYQTPMSSPGYSGPIPTSSYASSMPQMSSPYANTSPLQSMQQSVYGQSNPGLMGSVLPPGSPSQPYAPVSSPGGSMLPPRPPTNTTSGIKIQNVQTFPPGQLVPGSQIAPGQTGPGQGAQMPSPTPIRMAANANISTARPRMPGVRGARPSIRPGVQVHGQIRGTKPGVRMPMKRPGGMVGGPGQKRRADMLNDHVMSMQNKRGDGMPMISNVQGAKDRMSLGGNISATKKVPVNKEANAMANVLASRGISIKQKQKSRSPTPERPLPHLPNLGTAVSIKHTSKSSNFSIPEAKVGGGGMLSCKICKKMFGNQNSLSVHMSNAHPQSKIPLFKCDQCPASYPKSLQLQHHKRVFHNVSGPNSELGLPVVDLSQEDTLKKLRSLRIYNFIPLANREQTDGCFGIPIISVHSMQNGITSSLQALGADGILSLGPLKPLLNS